MPPVEVFIPLTDDWGEQVKVDCGRATRQQTETNQTTHTKNAMIIINKSTNSSEKNN
jgi:hypothetical protein